MSQGTGLKPEITEDEEIEYDEEFTSPYRIPTEIPPDFYDKLVNGDDEVENGGEEIEYDEEFTRPYKIPTEIPPDYYDNVETEDDEPVDSIFAEKQQRLLVDCLINSWNINRPFAAMSNVGLFYELATPPVVPDMLLSLDVKIPDNVMLKKNHSYFIWNYGKVPDVVIEVVSNRKGKENTRKKIIYQNIGIPVYVIFDPALFLKKGLLNVFKLIGSEYVAVDPGWFPEVRLGLKLWRGVYENMSSRWLRWCDMDGQLVPTGNELVHIKDQIALQEYQRAEQEYQRAERLAA